MDDGARADQRAAERERLVEECPHLGVGLVDGFLVALEAQNLVRIDREREGSEDSRAGGKWLSHYRCFG